MTFEADAAAATVDVIAALGRSVTLMPLAGASRSMTALFDRMSKDQAAGIGIEGERTWCEVSETEADGVVHGDFVRVDGADYVVANIERDHYGLVTLILEHAA